MTVGAAHPSRGAREAARVGLYVHVPFCAQRCTYCGFSSGSLSAAAVERYLRGVEREAALRAPWASGVEFTSVFFGGGTPSALSARHFARLWDAVRANFAIAPTAEITLEANPESVRPALLDAWRAAGVNRLSMGVQSFDPGELGRLGRLHGPERPGEAFALARAHGFRRLSLDLMFGFPDHEGSTWRRTLERTVALEPEHVSAYCFIPEEETPLGRAALRGEVPLPTPDEQADLYAMLTRRLGEGGYAGYEISNFCLPGGESRHNLVYWLRRDYLGLGPSAHGLWKGERYANRFALPRWAEDLEAGRPWDEREIETEESRSEEMVLLGLRLGTGLVPRDHAPSHWGALERRFGGGLRRAVATGRLRRTRSGYRIATAHRFVADEVIAWVLASAKRGEFDTVESGFLTSSPCPSLLSPAV